MTNAELFHDHVRRIAEITFWHAQGLISDDERFRYLMKETETTSDLYDQSVAEARY